jgi:valyl-tRNA synthetase
MASLKELCLEKIANEISEAPPMIQEMIIDETKDRMSEKIKKEIEEETKSEIYDNLLCNLSHDITNILTYLIPSITEDIMISITTTVNRPNFYEKYSNLPYIVVKCAIEASENIVNSMEERYVHNVFSQVNRYEEEDYDY